jgi:hypothetical protein
MNKVFFIIIFSFQFNLFCAPPDEGMWLPLFIERLNYADMQKKGLHLTSEELYSINNSSLKDAVVMLYGGECTSEIISPEGLILTNHHCGYDAIQAHSSIDHDYLTNGFWAYDKKDELKNEGMTASFLIRIEDVTEKVMKDVKDDMSETERSQMIRAEASSIEKDAEEEGRYNTKVQGFFEGNEYYLFVYQTFEDIRLVGAPPSSIGKFGGDTDNWMWPRQTCDFSIFRIYTSPDGKPAKYAEENIPLKPKNFLHISLKGIKNKDFAMIWGYPGKTERYLTSEGVKVLLEQTAPAIISLRGKKLSIMKEDMDANPEVKLKYSAKYSEASNYWKFYIGQSRGLNKLKVISQKQKIENDFNKWVFADTKREEEYGKVMDNFASAYKEINEGQFDKRQWYYLELFQGAEAMYFSFKIQSQELMMSIENYRKSHDRKELEDIRESAKIFYKDYNMPTDKKIFAALMEMFYKNIPKYFQPDIFRYLEKSSKFKVQSSKLRKEDKIDFMKYADYVYKKSVFSSEEHFNDFLNNPKTKKLKNDPLMKVMTSIITGYLDLNVDQNLANQKLKNAKRLFVKGLREMNPDKKYYSDANSTMRVTYGVIDDYFPADAVHYDFETTLKGVMEKEDSANEDFIVPDKLKALYKNRDFGRYGQLRVQSSGFGVENPKPETRRDTELITCFIANTDITGGNSGSPVINGNGELIGIAFDGNWEAMSGDIAYEPEIQRTICVDIRYVLFIIDKFAGATNLINELTINN